MGGIIPAVPAENQILRCNTSNSKPGDKNQQPAADSATVKREVCSHAKITAKRAKHAKKTFKPLRAVQVFRGCTQIFNSNPCQSV
jgi:hypothetical protein